MDLHDTIVAIASPPGGGLRGVVRVSGPQALAVVAELCGEFSSQSKPFVLTSAVSLDNNRQLPAELFIWPGRRSFTREPIVELHTIGAPPLLDILIRKLCQAGARLAEPGEFTLRAFLAGRIDLTQAEAVLGVIDAAGRTELDTALAQLAGGMAGPLNLLREELLLLLADLEAGLDFADEDIEFISSDILAARLAQATSAVTALVDQLGRRGVATDLPKVVLLGPTNAGKSSLFNALVTKFGKSEQRTSAIVSPEAGATRDYLIATVMLDDVAWNLIDTSGAEELSYSPSPAISAQAMSLAVQEQADLLLLCHDAKGDAPAPSGENEFLVITKCDEQCAAGASFHPTAILTSAITGVGLDELASRIAQSLSSESPHALSTSLVPSTALRSESALRAALDSLQQATQMANIGESEELVAAELRLALDGLGQVAGTVYTDDVLDRVFSRFCIGK